MRFKSLFIFERVPAAPKAIGKPLVPWWGVALICAGLAGAFLMGVPKVRREARDLPPTPNEQHNDAGMALAVLGKKPEALAYYQERLKARPQSAMTHAKCAQILLQLGRWQEAVTYFDKALELNPSEMLALRPLAWTLATCPDASVRNGGRAVELAARAVELSEGKDALAHVTLAAAYAESGRFKDALKSTRDGFMLAQDTLLRMAIMAQEEEYRAGRPHREAAPADPATFGPGG